MTAHTFQRLLSFAARNERRLGAGLFALGFLTDLFTFGLLPVTVVNYFFLTYLSLAALCTFGTHFFSNAKEEIEGKRVPWWKKTLSVLFPLGAQYALGGLLSGFFVFYAAHSVILASWPFLLLLLTVYAGNEYFRMHKAHLVFQTALFFFALYAYLIFALPLYLGFIGPWMFALSTLVSAAVFAALLWLLYITNKKRVATYIRPIGYSALGIIVAISTSYATGLVPPIPLALVDAGIYHSLTRVPEGYLVQKETDSPWWNILPPTVHAVPGQAIYAYSAVGAPIQFSSTVVHRWERKSSKGWVTESRIAFPISGGRDGGYRGYSVKSNTVPGAWRVSVETAGGQVIGRIRFDIESADSAPALIEEML
jgi:hypothetical protein